MAMLEIPWYQDRGINEPVPLDEGLVRADLLNEWLFEREDPSRELDLALVAGRRYPEAVPLAGGLPPTSVLKEIVSPKIGEILRDLVNSGNLADYLNYGGAPELQELRQLIAERVRKRDLIGWCSENILITASSQQGLDAIGKAFLSPGKKAVVVNPAYMGLIEAWRGHDGELIGVGTDEYGVVKLDELEQAFQDPNVVLFYVNPDFANPSGVTIPIEVRQKIAQLARKYGKIIVEDSPYKALRYEGEHLPPIAHFAPENTLYLESFSKTIAQGLRIAYMAGPEKLIKGLAIVRLGQDLGAAPLTEKILYEYIRRGYMEECLPLIIKEYARRAEIMDAALGSIAEEGIIEVLPNPRGGMFRYVRAVGIPIGYKEMEFLAEHGAVIVPSEAFLVKVDDGDAQSEWMRLNFTSCSIGDIERGVDNLRTGIIALREE